MYHTLMPRNPYREGDRVELVVEKMAAKGYGLGRSRGVVFLVPLVAPGDRVLVEVNRAKRSMCFADPVRLLSPGPGRVEPVCADYGDCGGCAHLHMDYAAELRGKEAVLAETLRAHPFDIEPAIPSPPLRYRNKLLMSLAVEGGRLVSGFYARNSHRLVDIARCHLQTDAVNRLRDDFRALAPSHLPPEGLAALTHLLIRSTRAGEHLLCVVARRPVDLSPLAEALRAAHPALATVLLFLNGAEGNVPFERRAANPFARDPLSVVSGCGTVTETVAGVEFPLGPESFFQVNAHQLDAMVETVAEFAGAGGGGTLLDLYCGAGFFGLTLRPRFDRVLFVDTSAAAIATLEPRSRADPGILARCEDAARAAERMLREGIRPDAAVVDPPRAGLEPSLADTLARLAPARIVMVSCHAATLARDLDLLRARGYHPARCRPIDNFPRTPHLECVVRLDREERP